MNASQVGRLVSERRRAAGWTQAQLALRIGTTQAAVSKIETGRTLPTLTLLDRIARALGTTFILTLGAPTKTPPRSVRRSRVREVLGDVVFDPYDRDPSAAEIDSLVADGLTRERFGR